MKRSIPYLGRELERIHASTPTACSLHPERYALHQRGPALGAPRWLKRYETLTVRFLKKGSTATRARAKA
eukprot:2167556-Prymnesium_polylepis.1